jgi:uncharacterized membrane protein
VVKARVAAGALLLVASGAAGQESKARAVLFFSPTCPHCHQVMTVDLPPLVQQYGERLQIITVSTQSTVGRDLYRAAVERFAIPDERLGVPALIMGSTVLVGSGEIPAEFPGMVQRALAQGGVDWPDIPGLRPLLVRQGLAEEPAGPTAAADRPSGADSVRADSQARAATAPAAVAELRRAPEPAAAGPGAAPAAPSAAASSATSSPSATAPPPLPAPDTPAAAAPAAGATLLGADAGPPATGVWERFRQDAVANTVAVVVLLGMLVALAAALAAVARRAAWRPGPEWLIPVLALAGTAVAAYLAYVETTGASAVCGPVGDCNTVQQSPYARIAGVLPVGVAGVLGYLLLLGAWLAAVAGPARRRPVARTALWGGALLGTLFSAYLTFLEPFVIGATCAWCITSALLMTALLLLATPAAASARRSPVIGPAAGT